MLPIQFLVNNLLYDFSQLAIPTDKVDEEYLRTPRKWNIDNVKKFMVYIGPISSIFDYATFGLMWFVFKCVEHLFVTPELLAKFPRGPLSILRGTIISHGWFVESLADADLDRAYHPDEPDAVYPEQAQYAVIVGHPDRHGNWGVSALFSLGEFPGFCAFASVILAVDADLWFAMSSPVPWC